MVALAAPRKARSSRSAIWNDSIRRFAGSKASSENPKFVECHRLAPFVERGTDVDVVLDLMIHDIDVITSLVRAPIERVEAVGVPVLTEKPDIANARITFANGCIANVTASRVSIKRERRCDFFNRTPISQSITINAARRFFTSRRRALAGSISASENIEIKDGDALADEIDSFLDCVRTANACPWSAATEGLRALEIASTISAQLLDRCGLV